MFGEEYVKNNPGTEEALYMADKNFVAANTYT